MATVLLALAGTVAGHHLAYLIAHPDAAGRAVALGPVHGYLGPVGAVLFPLGLAGFALAAVAAARSTRAAGPVRVGPLAVAQVGLFTVQELLEGVAAGGHGAHLVGNRSFLVGIVVQVALAGMLVAAVRLGGRAMAALWPRLRRVVPVVPAASPRPVVSPLRDRRRPAISTDRGPPLVLV